MRKIALVLALALILTTGTAFANDPRPDGLGIGIVGGGGGGWRGGGFTGSYGLSLHAANIYWGINLWFGSNDLRVGVSGDFMTLVGGNLVGPLGWYIDLGLYGGIRIADDNLGLDFGVRLPIGLNLNFQVVDLWLAFVPRIGVGIRTWDHDDGRIYLGGGWGPEVGIRVWL